MQSLGDEPALILKLSTVECAFINRGEDVGKGKNRCGEGLGCTEYPTCSWGLVEIASFGGFEDPTVGFGRAVTIGLALSWGNN